MLSLSVIIPTYRRAATLSACLDHLAAQTVADQLEVIVVSDGHDEDTEFLFFDPQWKNLSIQFLEVAKSQQGRARNEGVKQASAPTALFIGDDIFLMPDVCEKHLQAHRSLESRVVRDESAAELNAQDSRLTAVLGFTTWDPEGGITSAMRWLEESGWQFGYPMIEAYTHQLIPAAMQHRFTYTSHVSLPTSVAKDVPFRTDLALYGWEDVEWGMRLKDAGVGLWYEPDAKALHHHHLTLDQSLQRMETLGMSAWELHRKHAAVDPVPSGMKMLGYRIASLLPTIAGRHRRAFLRGIKAAQRSSPV